MSRGDVALALAVAVCLTGCARFFGTPASAVPRSGTHAEVATLVELINRHRERIGCKALEWDGEVAEVAQKHSADMVRRNFFDHTNPDGLNAFQRLARAGVKYTRAAENIAAGHDSGAAVFYSWLGSPGHRRNIEDCALRSHGIGFERGVRTLPYGTILNAWTNVLVKLR